MSSAAVQRRGRGARIVALALALVSIAVDAQQDAATPSAAAARPAPATPGNLTPAEKRCNAGLRRVDRQQQKLAETRRFHEAARKTVENCGGTRACEQATHRERTLDARSRNEERQLARLEVEARSLCAVAAPAPKPR